MRTIKTSYMNTVSMTVEAWDEFKERGKTMQVKSPSGKVLGYLMPEAESIGTRTSRNGYPIKVAPFTLLPESAEDKAARLARVEAYKRLKNIS